jgi:hypothetical protein
MRDTKAVSSLRRLLCLVSAFAACLTLAGCGALSQNNRAPESGGDTVGGVAHAGEQAVVGAKLYLYAASTNGYGSSCATGTPFPQAKSCSLLNSSVLTNNTTATDATSGTGVGGIDSNGNYYVTTGTNGSFNITGDWTCVAGTDIYFVLQGGNPGGYGTNNNLMMMAALGNCSSVPSFTFINEVSTVAAVYALGGFMNAFPSSTVSVDPILVSSGTSTASKAGLAAAFATVGNLENIATGVALAATPGSTGSTKESVISVTVNTAGSNYSAVPTITFTGGGGSGAVATATLSNKTINKITVSNGGTGYTSAPTVTITCSGSCTGGSGATATAYLGDINTGAIGIPPQANINTLASILAACENSTGGTPSDGSPCGYLFTDTTLSGGTAPSTTLQAASNLAHYPGVLGTTLYSDVMPGIAAAFTPNLSSAPNDWTMPIVFSGSGMQNLYDIAVDGNNNVWAISDGENGACGTLASSTGSNVVELNNLGVPKSGTSGYSNTADVGCPFAIAIDTSNQAWVVSDYVDYLTKLSTTGTFTPYTSTGKISYGDGLAFDPGGYIWVTNYTSTYVSVYLPSGNTWAIYSGAGVSDGAGNISWGIASDANGHMYIASDSATGRVDVFNNPNPGTTTPTALTTSTGYTGAGTGAAMAYPLRLVVDQANDVWVGNFGASAATSPGYTLSEFNLSGTTFSALSPNGGWTGGGVDAPFGMAVDGANNVWVANAAACSVSEFDNSSDSLNGSFLSPYLGFTGTVSATCGSSTPGTNAILFPEAVAIDEAGNVWIANYGLSNPGTTGTAASPAIPGFITELVGAATPVLTPISAATAAKTPAVMP